jgi:hypothetical protein
LHPLVDAFPGARLFKPVASKTILTAVKQFFHFFFTVGKSNREQKENIPRS